MPEAWRLTVHDREPVLPTLAVFPDPAHSTIEERFKAIGWADDGRGVLIVFTLRKKGRDTFVRPISARYMHRKEVGHYEKETAKTEKR